MDESLDSRIKTLFHPRQGREGREKEEEESFSSRAAHPSEMKVLLKKWYGLPKKDRGRITLENEEGTTREEMRSGVTFHPRPSPSSSSSTSSSLYDIPKKRRRYLEVSNSSKLLENHPYQSRLSSALIPVYSSSPLRAAENEEEIEEEEDIEEGEEDEPQNLVMESHKKSHHRESEDIQNNNNSKQNKEEEEKDDDGSGIRDGICSWCLHTLDQPRSSQFTMNILDDPTSKRNKSFCSERCFTLYRRAAFKKNKYCDLCKKPTVSTACIQYQTSFEDKLIFCSESCLKAYKFEEAGRREKHSCISTSSRRVLSDNLATQSETVPLQHKKSSKQSRRLQEKSHSQTPIVKVKPDMALKSNENSRKKQQQNPRVDQIPPPSSSSSTNGPHTFHMIPPHPPSTLRQTHPPFLGMLPEPPNSQPLLPLAALAGALAAASSSGRPSVSVPPPSRPPPAFQHPPQLHGSSSFPSPITLCPTPFFVPLPIPIPILIPVPEKSFKGTSCFSSAKPHLVEPGTSQQMQGHASASETTTAKVKTESPSPKSDETGSSIIKTEYSTLENENEERRRRKRAASSSSSLYILDHPNHAHSINFSSSYDRK